MKKFAILILIIFSFVVYVVPGAYAAVEIKLSHSGPTSVAGATNDEGCKAFKEYVEIASNGAIHVKIFPNNQLGNEREQMEGVQMGTIQMCSITTGTMSTLDSGMLVLDIPYLFSSKKGAYNFLDGHMGTKIREEFSKKTGTVMLAYGENGFRHFSNRVRTMKSPNDVKGLKIRTQENPAHIAMVKAMGGIPATIPFGELYTALSQGVVDGQENPASLMESSRLHEVQKYLTLDGHLYSPFVLIANGGFFKKLTAEQQQIVRDGATKWSERQRSFNTMDEKRSLLAMRDSGVEITELTTPELAAFRKVAREGALPFIEKEVGRSFVIEVLTATEKAEKQ